MIAGYLFESISMLEGKQRIFVFGSNRAGRHGAGSAKEAHKKHGAIYGQGEGLQGFSYAIPTKDRYLKTLLLHEIKEHVNKFLEFASNNQEYIFDVVKIGCGLAGYNEDQIIPMFKQAPKNVNLPEDWR